MDAKRTYHFHSHNDRPSAETHRTENGRQTKALVHDKRAQELMDEDRESDDGDIDTDILSALSAFERISAIWDSMCSDDEDDCE